MGRLSCRSETQGSASSSSLQEGSHLSFSHSPRRSHSPSLSLSRRSRSSGRCTNSSHAPSRSSHISEGSSHSPPMLSRHSSVVPPAHVSCRATPSATISRVPPSPPPTFVTPLASLPPPYSSRSGSVSRAPPSQLILLFPSMTPAPRYESPSPAPSVMGPPPTPCPSSQLTQRLPAPVAGNPALCAPTSIDHSSFSRSSVAGHGIC